MLPIVHFKRLTVQCNQKHQPIADVEWNFMIEQLRWTILHCRLSFNAQASWYELNVIFYCDIFFILVEIDIYHYIIEALFYFKAAFLLKINL